MHPPRLDDGALDDAISIPSTIAQVSVDRRPKLLFVASTGGHLAQLVRLSQRFNASDDSLWITFDSPQSRSLLKGRRVLTFPYVQSRDLRGVIASYFKTRKLLRSERFDAAISTGAALALGVLPAARRAGVPVTYVESVSRVNGPSMSGRLLARLGVRDRYTQHPGWAHGGWKLIESVLSEFVPAERPDYVAPQSPLKLFVTLGTIRPYRFDSAVDTLLKTGIVDPTSRWQLGVTSRHDLPSEHTSELMSMEDFDHHVRNADVVVTHAGVGTILQLLEMGIHPVVVPRSRSRKEHVDDHQLQIAALVERLGVATVRESHQLDAEALLAASGKSTAPRNDRGTP